MMRGGLLSVPNWELRKSRAVLGVLLLAAVCMQLGTAAITPDFLGLNQANKTIDESDSAIAYGDFLILVDKSTVSGGSSIGTITWSVDGFPDQIQTDLTKKVVFGPMTTTGAVSVTQQIVGAPLKTKHFYVYDHRDVLYGNFTYKADYAAQSATHRNGTLTLYDSSKSQISPPDLPSGWWWNVSDSQGRMIGNGFGSDSFVLNMSRDSYLVNVTVKTKADHIVSYNRTISGTPEYHPPIANFSAVFRNGTSPMNVSFIDQSVVLSPLFKKWVWAFGDGTFSSDQNPEHTFLNNLNPYWVNLTITDCFGVNNSLNRTNYIAVGYSPYPIAQFTSTPLSGEAPLNVSFIDQSIFDSKNNPNLLAEYEWRVNGIVVSNDQNFDYVFTDAGTYTIELLVTDLVSGRDASVDTDIIVGLPDSPSIFFNPVPQSGYAPLNVTFVTQVSGTEPLTYAWTFGDGSESTDKSPQHRYLSSSEDSYPVHVTVTDANGKTGESDGEVKVLGRKDLVADFKAEPLAGLRPFTVAFTDESSGNPDAWFWQFGDGYVETIQNPVHTYNAAGEYTVSLTVKSMLLRKTAYKENLVWVTE